MSKFQSGFLTIYVVTRLAQAPLSVSSGQEIWLYAGGCMALGYAEFELSLGQLEEKTSQYSASLWSQDFAATMAVDNQSGVAGRGFSFKSVSTLIAVEFVDNSKEKAADSKEPVYELSFSPKPVHSVLVHQLDLNEKKEKLLVGGEIEKKDDRIVINLDNSDRIVFDAASGKADVDSLDRYQKEVHYKGTAWQTTVLSSDRDVRITFGKDYLKSIETGGVKEVFAHFLPKQVGSEPRLPSSRELQALFAENGRGDLQNDLEQLDRKEAGLTAEIESGKRGQESLKRLAELEKERSVLLAEAAKLKASARDEFNACAEQQLREALRIMRERFGAGTPETREYADALKNLLVKAADPDQQEEVERLAFETKRAVHMNSVLSNLRSAGSGSAAELAPAAQDAIRKSLISMHIAGGDYGLAGFVKDLNRRLDSEQLVAPLPRSGFLKPGVVWLTPEGATRYNGDFEIRSRR